MAVSGAVVYVLGGLAAGDGAVETQVVAWATNLVMIGTVVWRQRARQATLRDIGVAALPADIRSWGRLLGRALLALVMGLSAFVLGSIVMANVTGVPEPADMSGYEFMQGNLPMLLLVLAGVLVASSFGEELVYRGFLTSRLAGVFGSTRTGWLWAGIVGAIVFGLAHFSWGPMGIVQTTFMGGALIYAWRRFGGNLWVVILAHAVMDVTLMFQMYLGG